MGKQTAGAVFDPLFCVSEASSAFFAQCVQRAVTEQTVKVLRVSGFVAGETLAGGVLEKSVMTGHIV